MVGQRSPVEVGIEVVAGLIAISGQRERAINDLRSCVEKAIRELDPRHERDRSSTWWQDHRWARPDPFDRFRRAFEDLWLLEIQAREVVAGLRSMLVPTLVRPSTVATPVEALGRLVWLAERRLEDLRRLELAERAVKPGLTPSTASSVRRAIREMRAEEQRGSEYRGRLARLLSMADIADRAV